MRELQNIGGYFHEGYEQFIEAGEEEALIHEFLLDISTRKSRVQDLLSDLSYLEDIGRKDEEKAYKILEDAGVFPFGGAIREFTDAIRDVAQKYI